MALDVQFCSRALTLIGANPIQSFTDGSAEAAVASASYRGVLENLITEHPWSFSKKKSKTLNQLVAPPESEFDFAYQLPSDFFNLLSVTQNVIEYDIFEGRRLLTSYDGPINIDYQFLPDESKFPPYFVEVLINNLAADFAIPITEDKEKAQYYEEKAERKKRSARRIDAKQVPRTLTTKANPLTAVRG